MFYPKSKFFFLTIFFVTLAVALMLVQPVSADDGTPVDPTAAAETTAAPELTTADTPAETAEAPVVVRAGGVPLEKDDLIPFHVGEQSALPEADLAVARNPAARGGPCQGSARPAAPRQDRGGRGRGARLQERATSDLETHRQPPGSKSKTRCTYGSSPSPAEPDTSGLFPEVTEYRT